MLYNQLILRTLPFVRQQLRNAFRVSHFSLSPTSSEGMPIKIQIPFLLFVFVHCKSRSQKLRAKLSCQNRLINFLVQTACRCRLRLEYVLIQLLNCALLSTFLCGSVTYRCMVFAMALAHPQLSASSSRHFQGEKAQKPSDSFSPILVLHRKPSTAHIPRDLMVHWNPYSCL